MTPVICGHPEAQAIDERILALWREGKHQVVIDLYPIYRPFAPEGFFGHYLMRVGTLGGSQCTAPGCSCRTTKMLTSHFMLVPQLLCSSAAVPETSAPWDLCDEPYASPSCGACTGREALHSTC
jgi:hypothetical protein